MIATRQPQTGSFVWIAEAGQRDAAITRLNQKRVRQQAKRYHVESQERRRLGIPTTFEFVDGLATPNSHREVFSSASSSVDAVEDEGGSVDGQPRSKPRRWITKSDPSVRKRLLRLQNMAAKLQHISEGGYSAARIEYNFDILDLSTFTSAHMGRSAATSLHDNTSARQGYLRVREASFLDYVPQLYTGSELLRTVVDCVLAQAQQTLCSSPRLSQADVYVLYERALRGLQDALNHEVLAYEPDVLCSVQLMQLFEVSWFIRV